MRSVSKPASAPEFLYSDLLPTGADETPYRLITTEGVSTISVDGQTFLKVDPEAIRRLTAEAMHDISHYLRPAHLAQLRKIIDDPEASGNDRFVALDLLSTASWAAYSIMIARLTAGWLENPVLQIAVSVTGAALVGLLLDRLLKALLRRRLGAGVKGLTLAEQEALR